jgi:hypothetical protein
MKLNTKALVTAAVKSIDNDSNLLGDIEKFFEDDAAAAPGDSEEGEIPEFDMSGSQAAPEGSVEDIMKGQKELDTWDRMVFDDQTEDWELQLEAAMIDMTPALIIVGESGVGKTTMIKQLAGKFLSTPVAYFNAPTMDPFIHLIGIPEVSEDKLTKEKVLAFVRKSGIGNAELLVLDEINRVTPAAQNALFELVAERQINGEQFGKLKMVWGAMNPPRADIKGRTVEDVEDALVGRFHKTIPVLAKPKIHHYAGRNGIGAFVAYKCIKWWYQQIEKEKAKGVFFKEIITPRVLEYIMITIQNLENRRLGKGDTRHRPLTPRLWNVEFDSITHHNLLRKDTVALTLPFTELKQMFLGRELYALSSLMDGSSDVDAKVAEIQNPETPDAGMMACQVILKGISTDRLHPHALVSWTRIGEFSKVLTAVDPEAGNTVINGRGEIAGYLFNKCVGNDVTKAHFSKNNKDHPVWKKATQGEWAIYKRYEYPINLAVKESSGFAAAGSAAAAAAGVAGGASGGTSSGAPPTGAAPGTAPRTTTTKKKSTV